MSLIHVVGLMVVMFLLQALTPPCHEVLLIDGNAQLMDEDGISRYVREQNLGLVGIGASSEYD